VSRGSQNALGIVGLLGFLLMVVVLYFGWSLGDASREQLAAFAGLAVFCLALALA